MLVVGSTGKPVGPEWRKTAVSQGPEMLEAECCDYDYVNSDYRDVESEFYNSYGDYAYWPSSIIINGVVVNCRTKPMECFDYLGREDYKFPEGYKVKWFKILPLFTSYESINKTQLKIC